MSAWNSTYYAGRSAGKPFLNPLLYYRPTKELSPKTIMGHLARSCCCSEQKQITVGTVNVSGMKTELSGDSAKAITVIFAQSAFCAHAFVFQW